MATSFQESKFKCVICEKDLQTDKDCFPSMEGGLARLHFGYGSRYDQLENMIAGRQEEYIMAICDDCFDKKYYLLKRVLIKESTEYILIHT